MITLLQYILNASKLRIEIDLNYSVLSYYMLIFRQHSAERNIERLQLTIVITDTA